MGERGRMAFLENFSGQGEYGSGLAFAAVVRRQRSPASARGRRLDPPRVSLPRDTLRLFPTFL
jgi:hypothetical protein